jgi:hypothetical protein
VRVEREREIEQKERGAAGALHVCVVPCHGPFSSIQTSAGRAAAVLKTTGLASKQYYVPATGCQFGAAGWSRPSNGGSGAGAEVHSVWAHC